MKLSQIIEDLLEEKREKALANRIGTPTDAKGCLKIMEKRVSVPAIVTYGDIDMIEVTTYYVTKRAKSVFYFNTVFAPRL